MAVQTAGGVIQMLRDRIRGRWAVIDDADIERSGGSMDKLVDMITRKTGESRAEVRRELRRLFSA